MKTILVDAINAFIIKGNGINLEMKKILDNFENRKIILTNADQEEKDKFGLINLPYELFSLEHSPEKINPKYYENFLSEYGLSAGDVVYFEHNDMAVKSAESVGIKTFHYDKDKKALISLEKFLKENI